MNRYPILIALALLVLAVSSLLNCADPLESTPTSPAGGTTQAPDTVIRHDTVNTTDTVTNIDTVTQVDTITNVDTIVNVDTVHDTTTIIDTFIDTVIHVDTVIIVQPDTGSFQPVCAQLSCSLKCIVWMFNNPGGNYRLAFSAYVEKSQPGQSLSVTIDGVAYQWDPNANSGFVVTQHLGPHATVTVVPNKPPARGHSIDVCVAASAL